MIITLCGCLLKKNTLKKLSLPSSSAYTSVCLDFLSCFNSSGVEGKGCEHGLAHNGKEVADSWAWGCFWDHPALGLPLSFHELVLLSKPRSW